MINKKGFSLIEIVIVLVVVGVLTVMTVPFITSIFDAWLTNKTERDLIFSARSAMNMMTREIRQVKNLTNINTFTATEFDFYNTDDARIDYKQSGTQLLRNSDEVTDKLKASGGLNFTYLDANNTVTGTKADIRLVRIRLILESGIDNVTVENMARLRNPY
ncbi:MAG: prepilin-type N-terminal cleavage/methylation domain-containing protein [Candidatus Omnitrophica bacterium]|nr:prepilin-type N-terminal cleavage/methylation domain-containing protein [Candidatus Omnitrophota bacterium]MBU1869230.1 prepilin-type N-terminal cleavage/methylation domain-containing protein [Candidatus Omnitrophota bacterium]